MCFLLVLVLTSLVACVTPDAVDHFVTQDKVLGQSLATRGYYMHDYMGYGYGKGDDLTLFFLGVGVAALVGLAGLVGPLFAMLLSTFTTSAYQPAVVAGGTVAGNPLVGRRRRRREALLQVQMMSTLSRLLKALDKYGQ